MLSYRKCLRTEYQKHALTSIAIIQGAVSSFFIVLKYKLYIPKGKVNYQCSILSMIIS